MTRGLPSADIGRSRTGSTNRRTSWLVRSVAGLAALGCMVAVLSPATADELDDQRSTLQNQLDTSDRALDGYHAELNEATAALVASRQSLADAEAALAKATSERDAAAAVDQQMATNLAVAEQDLTDGKARVATGQVSVEQQRTKAVQDMRTSHQQNTAMLSIGMLFTDSDAGDVSSRVQWASTLYNANSTELNRLTQLQLQLQNDQTSLAHLKDAARIAREEAAAHLTVMQAAERAAAEAEAAVANLVAENEVVEARAAELLAAEQALNAGKQAEMDDVTRRINERNAQREAEAAAARAAEAAAAAAAAAQRNAYQAPQAPAQQAPAAAASNGFPLARPAYGPYTSPFGWRTNPVLGYSELHDGLDIGAACGTPLYAAADGWVRDMYYAGGWGWKLTIDNGWVGGVQLSTGYNHAQGYIVSPGQWVARGQVVGYTGTTGLSTGCHLHFHVWINGQVTNPAPYL